jgi:uncharacterized protein
VDLPRTCYQRATALLTDPDGRLLVFDHVGDPRPGTQVPAGGIKAGEHPVDAAVRELAEESGITGASVVRKLGEAWHVAPVGNVPTGLEEQVHHAFHLHLDGPPQQEAWEWDECGDGDVPLHRFSLRWVDLDEASAALHPVQAMWIPALRASLDVLLGAGPPPRDVWVDPRLAVRPSPIEGRGLFATEPIEAGSVVIRLGGRLVSTAELDAVIAAADADPSAAYVDSVTVAEGRHLVLPPRTAAHFANHSCDPSLWHVGAYELATRRRVDAGEELTVDYGTSSGAPGFTMPCTCGAAACRGVVTSDDWQRPELQDRYGDHWTPALLRRIASA